MSAPTFTPIDEAPGSPLAFADAVRVELADDSPIATPADAQRLARDGFVQLPGVFSRPVIDAAATIVDDVAQRSAQRTVPLQTRGVYQQAFLQEPNVWQRRGDIRPLTFSTCLARLAADLLGVDGVRIYHDQALIKEAHGGRTPWHCDQYYWPVDTPTVLTVWIPLQDTPQEMGPVSFREGSHRVDFGRSLDISDESEARITRHPRWKERPIHEEPFAAGDVSFHYGWTFHGARPNDTDRDRLAMTVIYLPEDTLVTEPATTGQQYDLNLWLPGAEAGDVVDTWLNPVVWSSRGTHDSTVHGLPEPANRIGPFDLD